jgi:hypothetical protein
MAAVIGQKMLIEIPNVNPETYFPMAKESGTIPVAIMSMYKVGFSAAVEIRCERSSEKLAEWQHATYDLVLQAYKAQKAAYDEQVTSAAIQAMQGSVTGFNPLRNREIEKEELKKHCIVQLSSQSFEDFNAMSDGGAGRYPEFDILESIKEGDFIRFFEQAFEWNQMSYVFYPYFWGRKDKWSEVFLIDDGNDPLFTRFLRSGAARILVPVRPGFNEAILHYLNTGKLWNGGALPTIDSELYVSIVDEIKAQADEPDGGKPDGPSWQVTLPTSLIQLQSDSAPLT